MKFLSEGGGVQIKKEIFQGGLHWQILLGGGAGPKKNLQIWDLKRLVSLHSQVDFCMTTWEGKL